MDTNNWRPNQGTEPNMDTGDWRGQLQPESRQRIVNKIMDTLKRHLPVSGPEGMHELRKIAQRFEEKIFTAATSQSDYLRKISLKMLTMETKSRGTMANNIPSNQVGPSNKPPDPDIMDTSDWRDQLQPETRQRICNKIMDTLKTSHSFSDEDRLLELQKIAQNFEEKTYAGATSQSDYLQKIDVKMLLMEKASDWRLQLQPDSRQRIINKIVDVLKRHFPLPGREGLHEIWKIAEKFEEKIFTVATSQSDYLRNIALKLLTLETTSQQRHGQQ